MKQNKRAQNWTIDYALSLFLFIITITLISSMLADLFTERSYDALLEDAQRVTQSLMSEGYPTTWDATDVVRAGLLYDGRLSMRKLELLHAMNEEELYLALPRANPFAFTISNRNGTVLGVQNNCSVGPLPASTNPNSSNKTLAYYYRSDTTNELNAFALAHDADVYVDEELMTLVDAAHAYEVIIFEDPQFNRAMNTTLSATLLREEFRKAAQYGPSIIITGRFGTPVFGANTTLNETNATVSAHSEPYFFLNESAQMNFTTTYDLDFMPVSGGILGNLDGSLHQQPLVEDGVRVPAALWQYEDAPIYYFSDVTGYYNGSLWKPLLQEGITRMLLKSSVSCTVFPENTLTEDLVKIERLLTGHGEMYTLTVYMWRNPE